VREYFERRREDIKGFLVDCIPDCDYPYLSLEKSFEERLNPERRIRRLRAEGVDLAKMTIAAGGTLPPLKNSAVRLSSYEYLSQDPSRYYQEFGQNPTLCQLT